MNHEDIIKATADQEPAVSIGEESQEQPEPSGPVPFLQGSFALYVTPGGDIVLSTHTEQTGDQRVKVPAFVVRQAKKQNPALAAILDTRRAA